MVEANRSQNYTREQKYDIDQFAKFITGDRIKSDVFKGKHFNIAVICLDDGYEIPPHDEPYDVFFYVVSGRGIFTAGTKQWDASPGSIDFRSCRCERHKMP